MENWHWHFQFRFIPILSLSYLIPILSLSYPYLMMRDIVCNNRHSNHSNHHLLPSPSGPTYFLRWFEIGPFVLHTPLFVANITLPQTLRALQWLAISPGIWYFISSPASLLKPICYRFPKHFFLWPGYFILHLRDPFFSYRLYWPIDHQT